MDTLHATSQTNDQLYKIRIEDLEKQLDVRNLKIDSLCKELKSRSDELARQGVKHQIVCEARDENKFRVVQLESDIKVLRTENHNLKSQLKEQKEVRNTKELSLEVLVASYVDQIKKYEEKLKVCESKLSQFETEKTASISFSEKSVEKSFIVTNSKDSCKVLQLENDIKLLCLENEDLKSRIGNAEERKNTRIQTLETHVKSCEDKLRKHEETIEVEKITNAQLQKEIDYLKSLCEKQIPTDTTEIAKIMPEMHSVTKGVLEVREIENIITRFGEHQRNLQIKLEHEMKEKLQHVEEVILMAQEVQEIPKVCSPVNPQDMELQGTVQPQELQEKLQKEDLSKCTPLKPQNRRHQKTEKTKVKDSESQKTVKPNAAHAIPQKKNIKKNKKIKDENVYSPADQNGPVSVNNKTTVEDLGSNENRGGRQLRSRRKV